MIIVLLSIPDQAFSKEDTTNSALLSSIHTFRFLFMMVFVLAATGVVVKYLRRYQINYMYIFELDPTYKITQSQLFKVTLKTSNEIYRCQQYS